MLKNKENKSLWGIREKMITDPEIKRAINNIDFEQKIRCLIIEERNKRRMTQSELAEMMGTCQSVIARYEAGGSNPTIGFIQRYIDTLGLKIRVESY